MAVAIASTVSANVERALSVDEDQVNEHGIGRRLREIILGGQDGLVNVMNSCPGWWQV